MKGIIAFMLIVSGVYAAFDAEVIAERRAQAEGGDAKAQTFVGMMYAAGENVTHEGVVYPTGFGVAKDSTEAIMWFRKAAEQNCADAEAMLGAMYAKGDGVIKDPEEAVRWYRKAAEQGNAGAQYNLALMYDDGAGVIKNPIEAAKWYQKAAYQGNAYAQGNLGVMCANGVGVLKDEIEALAWFNLSAISGNENAVHNREVFERRLGRQVTLVAQQRSKEILKQIGSTKEAHATLHTTLPPPMPYSKSNEPKSSGSGAIISTAGYVLTAAHVVADAANITIVTAQGIETATLVSIDESNDLAVLKIADGDYSALTVNSSDRIRLGQSVATIGFPNIGIQGFSPKLTRGEISSINGFRDDPRAWQISVPVQPGNSGGPLLDENGKLIGVVVSKLGAGAAKATGDLPQNANYAVKGTYALPLLEPYLNDSTSELNHTNQKVSFEDMVAKAQQSVVLILVY